MNKDIDAFRTISEVSDELNLPQHVLRFWETRFSQIKPLKRGGGRRYYRPVDVELVGAIKHMLYEEGYTIKGVQRILRQEGVKTLVALSRGEPVVLRSGIETGNGGEDKESSEHAEHALAIHPGKNHDDAAIDTERLNLVQQQRHLLHQALRELDECLRLLATFRTERF